MTQRVAVIVLVTLGFFGLLAFLPPLRQNPAYHAFADTRSAFGVPNAANVFSSFALIVVGLLGLIVCARTTGPDRQAEITLMAGLALVGIGSAYYHLHPNNERLFWDRLPLALVVMSLVTLALCWHVSPRARVLLPLLVTAGVIAGVAWRVSEANGSGNLNWWWGTVEIYPVLLLVLVLSLFRAEARHRRTIFLVIAFFALAQVCDTQDAAIFSLGHVVSGHTLKHLAGAAAGLAYLWSERRDAPG